MKDKGNDAMKTLNLLLAVIVLVFGIAVGWGVNNYITNETKKDVKSLNSCVEENHEGIRDIKEDVKVYKAEQSGKEKLIEQKLNRVEQKLDAIIKAINNNGGLLICDPIDTPREGANN